MADQRLAGMLAPGMDTRPPAPGIPPRPLMLPPPQPVANNALAGLNVPTPTLTEHALLEALVRMMGRR